VIVVMERIEGLDLSSFDAALAYRTNAMERVVSLSQLFLQPSWAVNGLHAFGWTAGQICPKDILVTKAGRVRLYPADLAQGWKIEPSKGAADDIFALSVLLLRALYARPTGSDANARYQGLEMLVEENPFVPQGVEPIFERALYRDVTCSYRDVRTFAAELGEAVSGMVRPSIVRATPATTLAVQNWYDRNADAVILPQPKANGLGLAEAA
jgi:hypothetical protein